MKVTFGKDYKRLFTIDEYEKAKRIISDMKEDSSSPAEYAEYAVNAIGHACGIGGCEKVFSCSAEIAGNCRVWNQFSDDSGSLDIWLSGVAKTWNGFVEFGAYLSDIWSLDGENSDFLAKNHMFKVIYSRA